MEISFFARGLLIGLAVAAPVGPIGVLCIRRTLAGGRVVGFVSGLGAAVADALYGGVAAFGLTAVSQALLGGHAWLRAIGGVLLVGLGVRIAMLVPRAGTGDPGPRHLLGAFVTTLVLTLTNPATILSFGAIFAGLGLAKPGSDYGAALPLVLGILVGSASWWLVLSLVVGVLRDRVDVRRMVWVNRVSGGAIAIFGGVVLVSLLA